MTMIAGCPRCSTELLLPAELAEDDGLECPVCGAKFDREEAGARRLPTARVVAGAMSLPADAPPPASATSESSATTTSASAAGAPGDEFDDGALESLSARLRNLSGATTGERSEGSLSHVSRLLGDETGQEDGVATPGGEQAAYAPAAESSQSELDAAAEEASTDAPPASVDAGPTNDLADIEAYLRNANMTPPLVEEAPAVAEPQNPAAACEPLSAGDAGLSEASEPASELPATDAASKKVDASAASHEHDARGVDAFADQFKLSADAAVQGMVADADAGLAASAALSADSGSASAAPAATPFELPSFDDAAEQVADPVTVAPTVASRRPARHGRGLRMAAGVAGFGAAGILLGGYALLWIGGRQSDLLNLSSVLPDGMLPAEMRAAAPATPSADDELANSAPGGRESAPSPPPAFEESTDAPDAAEALANTEGSPTTMHDAAVAPATATQPYATPEVDAAAVVAAAYGATRPQFGELAEAVQQASSVLPDFLAGDLSDPASVSRTGQAYVRLAQLAETLTLASPEIDPNSAITQQLLAKDLLQQAASEAAQPALLDQVATRWLDYPRRTNQGVVLRGVVRDLAAAGRATIYQVELAGGETPRMVTILSDKTRHRLGDQIVVAGVIVPPEASLPGLEPATGQTAVLSNCSLALKHAEPVSVPRLRLGP